MTRTTWTEDRIALWIERIVWHTAAGAVLAVMILVLLGSLEWLDEVAPRGAADVSAPPPAAVGEAPLALPTEGGAGTPP